MSHFRQFWMVLGNGEPQYRHETEESARTEAERLARQCPGHEFYVLQAVGKCAKSDVQWSEPVDDDGIPF